MREMRNAECRMQNECGRRRYFCLLPFAFCLLCILIGLLLSGCNVAGAVAYKVVGPPNVPAKYVPAKEPMLVLVESYRQPGLTYDAEQLSRFVVVQIKQWDIAPTIDLMDLYKLRDGNPEKFAKMPIPEVGRTLGAKQVLYIDIVNAGVDQSTGTDVFRGNMSVRVRIVDCERSESRWPLDAESGYPVDHETQFGGFDSDTNPNTVRQKTYSGLAYLIVRNFRKWKPDSLHEEEMREYGMSN